MTIFKRRFNQKKGKISQILYLEVDNKSDISHSDL